MTGILVTGAAGFIGSNLVRHLLRRWPERRIVGFDALTYSGNTASLLDVADSPRFELVRGDVADRDSVKRALEEFDIGGIMHLAAESHVDRSIVDPLAFVRTNVEGTVVLLQEASRFWGTRDDVRFHHVSTDEVFGSLELNDGRAFSESTPYDPRSPYSASKAASDHFVRAWSETYGLPIVVTNCTNNYGPFQFPEKLIPVVIQRALGGEAVPVYGTGTNVRDWLYVEDHCDALATVFEGGANGETYAIGGETELSNLDLVQRILDVVDDALGREAGSSRELIQYVSDRPGHDLRYAMDIEKIKTELAWSPHWVLADGLAATVDWYRANQTWLDAVMSAEHRDFQESWYGNERRTL